MPTSPLSTSERSSVLLVDDDPDLLAVLGAWLHDAGYAVQTAGNVRDAMAVTRRAVPNVIITDLVMPRLDGHDLLSFLEVLAPECPVIVLSGRGDFRDAVRALRHGKAFDFLEKPLHNVDDLVRAIELALARRGETEREIPGSGSGGLQGARGTSSPALTDRDHQILSLLAKGLGNKQIADQLSLGEGTVRNILSQLYGKLGVSTRTQAVMRWTRPVD